MFYFSKLLQNIPNNLLTLKLEVDKTSNSLKLSLISSVFIGLLLTKRDKNFIAIDIVTSF